MTVAQSFVFVVEVMRTLLICSTAIALLLGLIGDTVQAQQPQNARELPLQVDIDHASFAYNEQESLLEVYLSFGAQSLNYQKAQEVFRTRLPVYIVVNRSTEAELADTPTEPVWADSSVFQFALPDTSGLTAGQHFVQQVRMTLQPGEYQLEVSIPASEETTRRRLTLRRDVKVPDYTAREGATLSEITLASSIERREKENSPFYKNGLLIRPNANQLYGQGLERLFYYAEAYQPGAIAGEDGQFTIYAYVARANELKPVNNLEKRYQHKAQERDILVGSFDLSELPSGSYFLRLALLNEQSEAAAQKSRKFFVYNPSIQREQTQPVSMSFETSPFASLPEEEVETELEQIQLIANNREASRISNLESLEDKRRFLLNFWQKRDPDPNTPVNEQRESFKRQVHYANERYSSSYAEGWETDRGRTLIKYGQPSEIEPHLYERNMAPHEIWIYDNIQGEGRSRFVFADRQGFGRFELIHSTVSGERSLPNWERELQE